MDFIHLGMYMKKYLNSLKGFNERLKELRILLYFEIMVASSVDSKNLNHLTDSVKSLKLLQNSIVKTSIHQLDLYIHKKLIHITTYRHGALRKMLLFLRKFLQILSSSL